MAVSSMHPDELSVTCDVFVNGHRCGRKQVEKTTNYEVFRRQIISDGWRFAIEDSAWCCPDCAKTISGATIQKGGCSMRYREVPVNSFFVVLKSDGASALLHKGEDGMPCKVVGVSGGWHGLVTAELSKEDVEILSINPEVQQIYIPLPANFGSEF